jgi:cytochrome c oxidase assembly protein subunit 15
LSSPELTWRARIRRYEVSPELFRRAAVAALAAICLVVATGAVVRLTASGLGCDNWPRCGDTPFPEKDHHAAIEFGNRVIALFTILFTGGAWLAARRVGGLAGWVPKLALAMFLGNVAQIPLGGLTVIFELHPLLVMAHFLLALSVLAGAVVLALEAERRVGGAAKLRLPREIRIAGLVLAGSCLVLVVTGAFATAAGPHAGGSDIRRLGDPLRSVYVHAGATGAFTCALLVILGYLAARRAEWPRLFLGALGVVALLGLQIGIGEIQYHTDLPWGLVLVHVTLAAAVWGSTVGLATAFLRPPASLSRV